MFSPERISKESLSNCNKACLLIWHESSKWWNTAQTLKAYYPTIKNTIILKDICWKNYRPSSEDMLSKPKDSWSLVPRMPNKLLKDISHFVSFFQIVVLIARYINEQKVFIENLNYRRMSSSLLDSYQLFVELLHGWI